MLINITIFYLKEINVIIYNYRMLIVGDRRVKLMEDSMRASGEAVLDYKFMVSSDGTMRTSFLTVQNELKLMNTSSLQKITVVCGIEDLIQSEYTSEGKRIMLTCPNKNSYEQTVRLQKHVEMFERKITDIIDKNVQLIWVVPHPVDIETYLRSNLRDSQKDLTPDQVRHARFLTRMLNDTFQQWEGTLRMTSGRLVVPWFTKFVSVTPFGSKKFTGFMKAIRAGYKMPSVSIQPLLPEAVVDGFDPSPQSIMRVMSALQGLVNKSSQIKNKENFSQTLPHTNNSQESLVKDKLESPTSSHVAQSCPPETNSVEVTNVVKGEKCVTADESDIDEIQWLELLRILPCKHASYVEKNETFATCHCGHTFNLEKCETSYAFLKVTKYSLHFED